MLYIMIHDGTMCARKAGGTSDNAEDSIAHAHQDTPPVNMRRHELLMSHWTKVCHLPLSQPALLQRFNATTERFNASMSAVGIAWR
jgi:hypothetical protein